MACLRYDGIGDFMTTCAILSDTHGYRKAMDRLDTVLSEADMIIHLGDTSLDGTYVMQKYPGKKVYLLNGNCDGQKFGENELVIEIEGARIFATHGHLYSARSGPFKMIDRAKELGCQALMYGHTHRAQDEEIEGIEVFNPGTLNRSAADPSYGYLVVNGDKAVFKVVYV